MGKDIGVVPAPDGTIYLVDINETHYWGSFCGTYIGVKNTFLKNCNIPIQAEERGECIDGFFFRFIGKKKIP